MRYPLPNASLDPDSSRIRRSPLQTSRDFFCEEQYLLETDRLIANTIAMNSSGLLREMADNHFDVSGKKLRPRICYQIGRALGIPSELTLPWAASCEILHNATLVHDDLQDRDQLRRGAPTTWAKYGEKQAINLGDFLILIATQPVMLSKIPAQKKVDLQSAFSKLSAEIVLGQSQEFELNQLENLEDIEDNYFQCIGRKTAALFSALALGVGIVGGLNREYCRRLESLLRNFGQLFQLQDDILDLYGDKKREQQGCDLKEGKVSFLIVTHLKHHPGDLDDLKAVLWKDRDSTDEEDITFVRTLFAKKQTLGQSLQSMHAMISHFDIPEELAAFSQELLKRVLSPIRHLERTDV